MGLVFGVNSRDKSYLSGFSGVLDSASMSGTSCLMSRCDSAFFKKDVDPHSWPWSPPGVNTTIVYCEKICSSHSIAFSHASMITGHE